VTTFYHSHSLGMFTLPASAIDPDQLETNLAELFDKIYRLEKALSKSPSQEKVSDFDPPVRTGDTQTQAETLVPTGNISHFELFREYNGHEWVTQYRIMKRQGYTFTNGGFSTSKCKHCGGDFVVGMCVYFDGAETPFWIDACAGCGHAWQERAVRKMVVSNV